MPKKSRSALIPRGGGPASPLAETAADLGAVPLSVVGARAPMPRSAKPVGMVLQKRVRDYAAVDQ